MNKMGVLKTKNGLTIFNNWLSWFIYTPTENLRITKKISTFCRFILTFSISYPISSNPKKINTFINYAPQFQTTIQITFFLYKYKNQRKI